MTLLIRHPRAPVRLHFGDYLTEASRVPSWQESHAEIRVLTTLPGLSVSGLALGAVVGSKPLSRRLVA
jgi:hypothetical protein